MARIKLTVGMLSKGMIMNDVKKLVHCILYNVPIKPHPSPLLQPSLCVLDAVYSTQQHYSAAENKNGTICKSRRSRNTQNWSPCCGVGWQLISR